MPHNDLPLNTLPAMTMILRTLAISCLVFTVPTLAAEWELLRQSAHHVELTDVPEAALQIKTTGNDPYIIGKFLSPLNAQEHVLEFDYFCPSGVSFFSAYWGPPLSEKQHVSLPDLTTAEGWQTYAVDLVELVGSPIQDAKLLRLDFGMKPDIQLQIRNVRLRPPTQREITAAREKEQRQKEKADRARAIAEYRSQSFPAKLQVSSEAANIDLQIKLPADYLSLELIEYPAYRSIADTGIRCDARFKIQAGYLKASVPRHKDGRDRLYSGWRLRSKDGFISARCFVGKVSPATNDYAQTRAEPSTQKGLSGISLRGPLQDFVDLGISAVTLNLPLTGFVSAQGGTGKQRIGTSEPAVYFNNQMLKRYESLTEFCREHKIVVSAIVLVPRSRGRNRAVLAHPESDGGTYAMPDLTTARGVEVYSHVLDRVADHFSDTEKSPGGITNWIAHNEVDYHTVWTNMGRQPRDLYIETYYRSMRMIHNAAVSHNPHARVFASLTHNWNVPDDGKWTRLSPRDFLRDLQRYSELEGDFAWGVAYHPYPQSLFSDVAWRDKKISDDFDTPLITIQNLQVLGRFLQQPAMRAADGKVRPVILSEQGFHSRSYEDEAQANQAGSLRYAMQQVRAAPWVESFHYHRWIDHPNEGGLLLGLRTLPTDEDPHGKRKRSWFVYQAIGTEREKSVTAELPGP